jgi:hypothetical protein
MRHLLIAALAGGLTVSFSAAAGAENHACQGATDFNTASYGCGGKDDDVIPAPSPAPSPLGGASPHSRQRTVPMKVVAEIRTDEDGNDCIATVAIPFDQPVPSNPNLNQFVLNDCPVEPSAPGGGEPAVEPEVLARQAWLGGVHPQPRPEVPPGRSIVGLPAYLVSNTVLTDGLDAQTEIGPLRLRATGELFVDWGDGSGMTGPYDSPGRPYPDGGIHHVYQHHGTYDITVVQRWRVQWTFDDASGTFSQDAPPVIIDDYPVIEVQAVVQ